MSGCSSHCPLNQTHTVDKKHKGIQAPKWANFKPKTHPKHPAKTQAS